MLDGRWASDKGRGRSLAQTALGLRVTTSSRVAPGVIRSGAEMPIAQTPARDRNRCSRTDHFRLQAFYLHLTA